MFTESYEDDISANDLALKIYDDVLNFFKSIPVDAINKYRTVLNNGKYHGFIIHSSTVGTIIVAFGNKNNPEAGGYGLTPNGKPFILLNLLEDGWEPSEIEKLSYPRWRKTFVHEAIHLIDNRRVKPTYKTKFTTSDMSKIAYYNSPEEINTFFHEFITDLRSFDDYAKEILLKTYKTPKELTNYFYDNSYWDKDKFLTTANRNRIKKRIYRTVINMFFGVDK